MELLYGQKAVRVIKAESNADNPYSIINKAALLKALNELPANSFKLWMYLAANKDGYEFGLSRQVVMETCGIAKNTYLNAVNTLIEKGYLVQVELYPNLTGYLFIEEGFCGSKVDQGQSKN